MTDDDKAMLDFAALTWRVPGNQEQAIRDRFDLPTTRYWQKINRLIDTEQALAYNPAVVNRLRRLRATRRSA